MCLKSFKDGDYSRVCFGCKFKVCEDCATSYTKIDENQDEVNAVLCFCFVRERLRCSNSGSNREDEIKNPRRFLSWKPQERAGDERSARRL